MGESNLSYSFLDLYQDVLSYQGQGRDSSDADAIAKAKRRVNDGYRNFLALDWIFLSKTTTLDVIADTYSYALPDDFAIMRVPFKLSSDLSWRNPVEIPIGQFLQLRSFSTRSGTPSVFTFDTAYTVSTGVRYTAKFYPTPNASLTYNYVYKLLTSELSADDDIPFCPANISQVLRAFCLAEVETFDEEGSKTTWIDKLYQIMLPAAIKENSLRSPNTVGNMNRGSGIDVMMHPRTGNQLQYGSYSVNI